MRKSGNKRNKAPSQQCIVRKLFADDNIREQEMEVVGKDGNKIVFWCKACVTERYESNRRKLVVEISRDITEQKLVEENLWEAHNKLESKIRKLSHALAVSLKEVEEKKRKLIQRERELKKVNKEIIETNQALSVLARNIDKEKELLEKKIYETTYTKIMPIIAGFQSEKKFQKHMAELEVLKIYITDLISKSNSKNDIIISLTDQEMRVAAMIKQNLTNKKISNLLCISEHTVKTHRRNIRKKLKIKNSNINLGTYLKSELPDVSMQIDSSRLNRS
jgi:ATP/maltotriose-dependent transcriptional regulator MalT